MKKNWKTWIAGGAALTLLVSALTLPTLAASGSRIAHLGLREHEGHPEWTDSRSAGRLR